MDIHYPNRGGIMAFIATQWTRYWITRELRKAEKRLDSLESTPFNATVAQAYSDWCKAYDNFHKVTPYVGR